jgi:uncharacterized membrane protein YgdD (TMEM256/DUF423 family)
MSNRTLTLVIGILGISGVALGAFGAHALKALLAAGGHTETWRTAVLYQLIHTVAILAVSSSRVAQATASKSSLIPITCTAWTIGIVLFSGSLYVIALGGPNWLGPVTPLGGLAFLIGWGCVLVSGLKKEG